MVAKQSGRFLSAFPPALSWSHTGAEMEIPRLPCVSDFTTLPCLGKTPQGLFAGLLLLPAHPTIVQGLISVNNSLYSVTLGDRLL